MEGTWQDLPRAGMEPHFFWGDVLVVIVVILVAAGSVPVVVPYDDHDLMKPACIKSKISKSGDSSQVEGED